MPKATITIGISASGKTTWAKKEAIQTGAFNLNRDDLRFSLTGHDDWSTYKFTKVVENAITDIQFEAAKIAFAAGRDVILSDTNLNPHTRKDWVRKFNTIGFDVEIKVFDIPVEEAIRRDSLRPKSVGEDVIRSQYEKFTAQ